MSNPPDMSDQPNPPAPLSPPAIIEVAAAEPRRHRFSLIWLIPIVAAGIAGWLGWQTFSNRGPLITIAFDTADGISAGRTKVTHMAVEVGQVEHTELSDDLRHVVVRVRMTRQVDHVLTDHTRFWVVRPRLNSGSISGLETIVSGAYIEMDPGTPGGESTRSFQGLSEPPGVRSDEPGRFFVLHAARPGSVGQGSPLFFHDLAVGEVLSVQMDPSGDSVKVQVFVHAPYADLVHDGTRFWNASGVSIDTGADGLRLQLESLQAVLSGGVAFDTDPELASTPIAVQGASFNLYANSEEASAAIATSRQVDFITYMSGPVKGITPGSPVLLFGQRIGSVTDAHLEYVPDQDALRVPIRFSIDRSRIAVAGIQAGSPAANFPGNFPGNSSGNSLGRTVSSIAIIRSLLTNGMHVELQSTSLITGQQAVALVLGDKVPDARITREGGAIVVPGTVGGFDDVASSAASILRKVDQLPIAQMGATVQHMLAALDGTVGGPELKQTLDALNQTLTSVHALVQNTDAGLEPLLHKLPQIATSLQDTATRADHLVGSVDSGYGANSDFRRQMDRLLDQVTEASRAVRQLADFLDRHPEALIRGRTSQAGER